MKLGYLGDASDHWKGSLHEHLRSRARLKNLHAVGMFADGPWGLSAVEAYARLLRLPGAHAVLDANLPMPRVKGRAAYFSNVLRTVPPDADLLVDPDTGIKNGATGSTAHISVAELAALLGPTRVLMVFDESHDRRIDKSAHVRGLAAALVDLGTRVVACESGRGVTMFFISKHPTRTAQIDESLCALLGPAAKQRVTRYP